LSARKRFDGQILLAYAAAYAGLRAIVELFRGDAGRGLVRCFTPGLNRALGLDESSPTLLSTSQLVSLAALVLVALAWRQLRRRRERAACGVPS
jgi:prolipoprotein diacylglyceryltransferase